MRIRATPEMDGKETIPHLDPWTPRPSERGSLIPPPVNPRDKMLSSEEYIAILESKLTKLKGRGGKEPSAKEIIQGLGQTKETHMTDIIASSETQQFGFDDQWENSIQREDSRLAALQRRLQPEQALNAEELKELLENDQLAKMLQELREQEEIANQLASSDNTEPC